jgi:hypothetical protein
MCTYSEVVEILDKLKFAKLFYDTFWDAKYPVVGYGQKKQTNVNGLSKVAEIFWQHDSTLYVSGDKKKGEDLFCKWTMALNGNDPNIAMITVAEILDWGKVTNSNLFKAISLHNENTLQEVLNSARKYFDENTLQDPPRSVPWSSGWTKVYSFTCDNVCKYDSRCAAFLNYALLLCTGDDNRVKSITSPLLTFTGNTTQDAHARRINRDTQKKFGIRPYYAGDHAKGMIANKMASWVMKYLSENKFGEEHHNRIFKCLDKCAYMIGYDVSRLPHYKSKGHKFFE